MYSNNFQLPNIKLLFGLFWIYVNLHESFQFSTKESDSYIAAVVEFNPAANITISTNSQDILNQRTNEYINFISHIDGKNADIIVFPQGTLTPNSLPQVVPNPYFKIVPCTDNVTYSIPDNPIKRISCAAREQQKYVVINLFIVMINYCSSNYSQVYSGNVVFDRNGEVVSIYREMSKDSENSDINCIQGKNRNSMPDISFFGTDFGVTFGHMIGSDIFSQTPSENLINNGIVNFIYPTRIYSELPFFTAVQIQQGWAYSKNVNLLAAGEQNLLKGNTGSGIYSGQQGALKSIFSNSNLSQILVSQISKIPGNNSIDLLQVPITKRIKSIKLYYENMNKYSMISLNPKSDVEQQFSICYQQFCCNFNIQLNDLGEPPQNYSSYSYVAAAYHYNQSYDRQYNEPAVSTCSILACTDNLNFSTCAQNLFSDNLNVVNRYVFNKIEITGTFLINDMLILPSTLTTSLLPLNSEFFTYQHNAKFMIKRELYEIITMKYIPNTQQKQQLLTFGIFARGFNKSAGQQKDILSVAFIIIGVIINIV